MRTIGLAVSYYVEYIAAHLPCGFSEPVEVSGGLDPQRGGIRYLLISRFDCKMGAKLAAIFEVMAILAIMAITAISLWFLLLLH